jgi:hypothetical protein
MTGLLGTGPRAMPLRAAPGEKLGAAACAAGTKRNRCCRHRHTPCGGACQVGNARTAQASQPGPGNIGRPFGQLCV